MCVCVCVCLFVCLFDRVSRSRWSSHDAHVSWENIVGVCAPDGERCQTLVLGRQNCSPPRNLPGLASRPWGNRSFAVGLARPYAYALLSSASSGGPVGGRMLLPPLPCLRPAGYWTLRPICPPCHVCGWRGTGRSVPSAPPPCHVYGRQGTGRSVPSAPRPFWFRCVTGCTFPSSTYGPAGHRTLNPICPPCHACGRQGTGRSVPSASGPCSVRCDTGCTIPSSPYGPVGYRTLSPICPPCLVWGRRGTGRSVPSTPRPW